MVDKIKCMIHGNTEYDCVPFDETKYEANINCIDRTGLATYY